MKVIALKQDAALAMWTDISHILLPALEYSGGKYNINDLLDKLRSGSVQIWIALDHITITGAAVTEITHYPRKSMLVILCVAGKDFSLWGHELVNKHLIPYAKYHDLEGIEFLGRKGWLKRASKYGFTPIHTVFELAINEGEE